MKYAADFRSIARDALKGKWGIGSLWLNPYKQAATAAFYREISGTTYVPPAETEYL